MSPAVHVITTRRPSRGLGRDPSTTPGGVKLPTRAASEMEVRVDVGRLNMLFAGSSEGAHRACVLLGIVATCRAIGVPVQAYLAWPFERLGTHRDEFGLDLEQITPAAFKTAAR